jgi:sulfotransferase family protein
VSDPILVTGAHRTGTTWVGRMLAASGTLGYMHEPFNPNRWPGWMPRRVPHWYLYVTDENEAEFEPLVRDLLSFRYPLGHHLGQSRTPRHVGRVLDDYAHSRWYRARGLTPLIKDPLALFASEWLARRFGARVIVMIRHPAAFASSVMRLGWDFDFRPWLEQPLLLRDRLGRYEDEMRRLMSGPILDQAILLWKAMYEIVEDFRATHPDWLFVRHEDLAADPIEAFGSMYRALDLPWTGDARRTIVKSSAGTNPKEVPRWRHTSVRRDSTAATTTWKQRLTDAEVARIRDGVGAIGARFYSDAEW